MILLNYNSFIWILFFALYNAGLYLVATKVGLIEFYDYHRKRWMPERCEFCLFFWMSVLEETYHFVLKLSHFYLFDLCIIFAFAVATATLSRKIL
jgi:hypothetical protein